MKKLFWTVALVVGLSQASGCIIESSSNDFDGSIRVDWLLTETEGGFIYDTCRQAGIDIVSIEAAVAGTSTVFFKDVDCERFLGEIFVPPDVYLVDLVAFDDITGEEAGRTAIPGRVDVFEDTRTDLLPEGPFEIVVGIPALRQTVKNTREPATGLTSTETTTEPATEPPTDQ